MTKAETSAPLELAHRAARWQLAHMPGADAPGRTAHPLSWVQASFHLALCALADATGDVGLAESVFAHGAAHDWRLGERRCHADDHLIGDVWLWAHARDPERASIAPLLARFDDVLANPPNVALTFASAGGSDPCQERWCWIDALFMAPPIWAELSVATGDGRYLAYADREWRAAHERLFDSAHALYHRDSRAIGGEAFWSRGNGWALAGLARFLTRLPPGLANGGDYVAWFFAVATRVRDLQRSDGLWSAALLQHDEGDKETSGSALIVFALARGVNEGWLERAAFQPAVQRGWAALAEAVDAEGRLGWVQRIAGRPAPATRDDTQVYGVAALILAATEVAKLAD